MPHSTGADGKNFITTYVSALLDEVGLAGLTEDQKRRYLPQLARQVEERIGLELLPRLTDEQMEEFTRLAEVESTTNEVWEQFWRRSLSDFDDEVKRILANFAREVAETVASVK